MEKEKPLVSFIITYYNLPVQMLQECIDSILALSLRPFEREIIVIDDGSDMSPINDLMKYGDDIIYVRQKNGGLSMARNKGIDVATGTYIQFVDADDRLVTAPYEQCLDIIRYQQDVDMVTFDFTTKPQHIETIPEPVLPVNGSTYMCNNNIHGTACGYLFKKTILGELRFTSGIYHEDEEFTPQLLLRAENVYSTHFKAYYYNQRVGSITSSKDKKDSQKRMDDREGILFRLHELCDKLPHQDRIALERRIAQLTMDYLYNIILETRSAATLEQRQQRLHDQGLFPLPGQDYTWKYTWFRRLINTSWGRTLLLHTLPIWKKER